MFPITAWAISRCGYSTSWASCAAGMYPRNVSPIRTVVSITVEAAPIIARGRFFEGFRASSTSGQAISNPAKRKYAMITSESR